MVAQADDRRPALARLVPAGGTILLLRRRTLCHAKGSIVDLRPLARAVPALLDLSESRLFLRSPRFRVAVVEWRVCPRLRLSLPVRAGLGIPSSPGTVTYRWP